MPRLKGTKNKKHRMPRLKLPPTTIKLLQTLAADSGLPFGKVHDDAVLEGASELRTEVYAGLIKFNASRGAVIHERDREQVSAAIPIEAATDSLGDTERHNHDDERPGHEAEVSTGDELPGDFNPGEEAEPREIPF